MHKFAPSKFIKMKKIIVFLGIILPAISFAQIKIGAGLGLTFNESTVLGPQVRLQYQFDDYMDLAGTYNYYLNKDAGYAFDFDFRYHLINIGNHRIKPMAGLSIRKVGGVGLNVGLVMDFQLESFRLYIEPKYVIDDITFFGLSAGVMF